MEYIDLRKVGSEGLKQIRSQVVRLKKMGKGGREIEELTGVRQNRISEIWTAYQREWRSVTGAEKIREETRYTYAAGGRRTSGDPRSHHGKSAGRFWDTGEIVDAGTDEAIHSKAVP